MSEIGRRKLEHLDLCAHGDVEGRRTTLLEQVHLLHDALPDLSLADVDLSTELLGRTLRLPIVIGGMTGGTAHSGEINRTLAAVAQKFGLGFGLGSQRAMWRDPAAASSYQVRDVAPDVLLLGNLGAVQVREAGAARAAEAVAQVGADALCVHLNVAQELVQDEGDRDFRGCLETIAELVETLPVPVVVKETGCGLSPGALARIGEAGVRHVDVSGVGGTTWTGVEALRGSARQRALGAELREWGIPTAATILFARSAGLCVIGSGGLRDAHDVVRALALGARAAGMALPFLRALDRGGAPAVRDLAQALEDAIRARMLLVGARRVEDLPRLPRILGDDLARWAMGPENAPC